MANPMYRQIAEDLRAQIESGGLRPGQQLRTEIELREHYGASRNTVRDAIKWLTTLGLVETRPGQGTFVVQKIDPFVTTLTGDPSTGRDERPSYLSEVSGENRKPCFSPVQVEIQEAADEVAARLIDSRRHRSHQPARAALHRRQPMVAADLVLPGRLRGPWRRAAQEPRNIEEGTVEYLGATLRMRQVGYRDWITVRAPNPSEADFFKLPPDGRVPMYEISRTAFDGNGQPMRLTVTVYPADRNQFLLEVGIVPKLTKVEPP